MRAEPDEIEILVAMRKERDLCAARLGAALLQFDGLKASLQMKIERSLAAENKLGAAVCARFGLPENERHRITVDGAIERLEAGEWVEV